MYRNPNVRIAFEVMKRDILANPTTFILAVIFARGILLISVLLQPDPSNSGANTWSIVALDPATGDVGAAGASCVPVNAVVLAALVPGKGAAAVQAEFVLENRDMVYELLQQGLPAEEIRDLVTDGSADTNLSLRQYGIVTLDEGTVRTAGFTGEGNFSWSGDIQDTDMAVSAQGNTLESEDVVGLALEAFKAEDIGPLSLPDRLLRALEAGSAAGGDKRCNLDGVEQTALSAFVAVVKADQAPFAAPLSTSTELGGPVIPWLYVSVIEKSGGANPLVELRRQYDQWRVSNLPPCPLCDRFSIVVPPGSVNPDEVTEQPAAEQLQTIEPTLDKQEPEPSATVQAAKPSELGDIAEPNDASLGVVILLLLIVASVIAIVTVFIIRRRSRIDRQR
ncbi:MAG: DUF1028 domain-containing protein [Candidatus Promineifilaceae bacterium]